LGQEGGLIYPTARPAHAHPAEQPHPHATPHLHQIVAQSASTQSFRGNKQALPSKPCVACGRPMVWRRNWAKNWDAVKFCSDACRRKPSGQCSAARASSTRTADGDNRA